MKLRTEKAQYELQLGQSEQAAKLFVSPLTSSEVNQIIQTHTKTSFHQGQKQEEINDLAIRLDRFCRTVSGWENILDANGNPIECNDANKRQVADHNFEFVNQVFQLTDEIHQDLESHHQRLKKN